MAMLEMEWSREAVLRTTSRVATNKITGGATVFEGLRPDLGLGFGADLAGVTEARQIVEHVSQTSPLAACRVTMASALRNQNDCRKT
jgi:hypothetical protein